VVKGQAYHIRPPERLSTALRQSYVIELALFDQRCKGFDHFFDRDLWIYSRAFKEIELFEACEVFVDVVDASAKIFGADVSRSGGPIDVEIEIGEHTMNREQVHLRPDLPG
jgi:hypothetical protein